MADEGEAIGGPPGLPYRPRAREHLARARKDLARGDPHSTLAACLFLRMGIEALAYDLLAAYRAEVDFTAMRKWQPSKVIKELLEIHAHADRTVSISIQDADGKEILSGRERRLEADWIASSHNALGSFLHEPTIRQVEEGRLPQEAAIRGKAEAIAVEVDAVLASTMHNINIGRFVGLECLCGFRIRRRMEALKPGVDIGCAECGRHWSWAIDEGKGIVEFREPLGSFRCIECGNAIEATHYDVERGARTRCECGVEYVFVPGFSARPIKPAPDGDGAPREEPPT